MIFFLIALVVAVMTVLLTTTVFASDAIETIGEMEKDFDGGKGIASAFESYKIQDTVRTNDSDVDGDIQYTIYFDRGADSSKTVIPGYNGTRIALYAVNTATERIGTDANREIIGSMLERGYLVIVVDYLNNSKASGIGVATSAAKLQSNAKSGKLFDKSTSTGAAVFAKSGTYQEVYVVPSGHNLSLENVFWEIDKHSMEGTLDKIVENWNSDFRAAKANKIVKWVKADGTRKTTRTVDGAAAVWYADAAGTTEDAANGQYVRVKFTVAESITDCVDPDGTPLDMNLYANVIYPTCPKATVPVYVRASAHGDLAACTVSDTPRYTLFQFNGYALASFDYLWVPMALETSYGYYDGSGGETKDHMNYGLMMYNDKLVNTAAMRFLRHLSANGGETYNFALDRFGVIGASKGGWFTFLGEKIIQSPLANGTYATVAEREEAVNAALSALMSDRYYSTEAGKTRYQVSSAAIEGDVYSGDRALDAGERQPWLTYPDGSEIISGCQAVYAGVGSQVDDVTAGHAPIFEIANLYDDYSAAYGSANDFINIAKNLDIEAYYFDTPLGHSIAKGPDLNYGVDTFDAMVAFFDYYLKNGAVSVLYTEPRYDERTVSLTDKITVKFIGSVSASEISKITVASASGAVTGTWSAAVGKTEWTFTPDALVGNTAYTVTVPADLVGSNGTAMGEAYVYSFVTEYDNATALIYDSGYYTFTAPAPTGGNSFAFRFFVENDAVNTAELYAVCGKGDTEGDLLGNINVSGSGSYEIDVTDYILANAGKEVTLLLKEGRGTVPVSVINDTLAGALPGNMTAGANVTLTPQGTAGGRSALKAVVSSYTTKGVSKYYLAESKAFTYKNVTGGYTVTAEDVGRMYTVSVDIYDTISRTVTFRTKSMTKKANGTLDYDRVHINVNTKAGEWTTVEFTYTVYETAYGAISDGIVQALDVHLAADGNAKTPVYFSNFKVDEVLTSLEVGGAYIAEKDNGLGEYTAPVSDKAFAVYNIDALVGEYTTFANALSAYTSGYTIKLQSDYTLTDADISDKLASFATVNIDLGTYTVTCENTKNSLVWIKATSASASAINITGGNILLGRTALVSYEGASSAGSGKNVNINLYNNYIGFKNNAYTTEIISDATGISGIKINANISLTDCILDLPEERRAKSPAVIFPTSETADLDIAYKVSGGEIRLTKTRWISILENNLDLEFTPNASGKYTVLVTPSYIAWEIGDTVITYAGYATFVSGAAENGYVTRTLVVPENSTRYGIIPENYLDAEAYPFVVFDGNGNFVGAYANFMGANKNDGTSAVSRAKILQAANTTFTDGVMNNNTSAVILMRRDYTYINAERYDNWAQIAGEITIDLGGYSMYQDTTESTRRSLFGITSKAWTNSSKFPYYWDTTINIINGNLNTYDKTFFGLSGIQSDYAAAGQYIAEKDFTFNFADVTLALIENSPLTDMMVTCNNAGNPANFVEPAPFNLNFDNCVFDITNSAAQSITVLDADSDDGKWLKLTFKIGGGKILAGDNAAVKSYSSNGNYGSSIGFERGSDGEYITLVAGSDLGSVDTPFPTDEGTMYLTNSGTDGGKVVYKLEKSASMTDYGALPESEAGTENSKPFAVFAPDSASDIGYTCSGVFAAWKDAAAAAVKISGSVIYLRADATWSAGVASATFSGNFGHITVDLNGHTLTKLAGYLVDIYFTNTKAQTTGITFKNGTFVNSKNSTSSQGIFCLNYGDNTALATFDLTFDNIEFINEKTTKLLFTLWEDKYATQTSKGSKSTVIFNDCTIDTNGVTIFTPCVTASRAEKTDIDIVVNGGTIKFTKALTLTELYTKNSDDTVKFGRGKNGEYTKIIIPADTAYPESVTFEGTAGEMLRYAETATAGTYVLGADEKTDYGTIPARFASEEVYPFAVFFGGEFKSAETSWRAAVTKARSFINAKGKEALTAEIVLRRNYDVVAATDSGTNFTEAYGTVWVDLGGYTMNNIDTYIIDTHFTYSEKSTTQLSSICFKNGTLYNRREKLGMIPFGHSGTSVDGSKKAFSYTFENVTFRTNGTISVINDWGHDAPTGLDLFFRFVDCTFDFTGAESDGKMFAFATNKTNVVATFTFEGGSIIANAINDYSLVTQGAEDTVIVKMNAESEYITLTQLTSSQSPKITLAVENGKTYGFVASKTEGSYTVFTLAAPTVTEYGEIPANYSAEKYPFAVFDENGNFLGAYATLFDVTNPFNNDGAFTGAANYLINNIWDGGGWGDSPKAACILMRRNYVMGANERHDNLSLVQGLLTIDLGGYELTAPASIALFDATIKPVVAGTNDSTVFPSEFSIIGGDIVLQNSPLVKFVALTGRTERPDDYVATKTFTFNFEDVNVKVIGNTANLTADFGKNSTTPNAIGNTFVNFIDCTLDITEAMDGIVLFGLGSDTVDNNVTISGGEIIAGDTAFDLYNVIANNDASLLFKKNADGNYTELVLSAGAVAPAVALNDGTLAFEKRSETDTAVTYKLVLKATQNLAFTPKTSITLGSELVYNIYVPAVDYLKSFTVDGVVYEDLVPVVLDDGNFYYHVKVSLPAKEAARNIVLKVTVTVSDKDYIGTWTVSIPKYAASLLETSVNKAEKTLVRDVLAYIRAAYAYFGTTDEEQMAKIDTLLGEYSAKPTVEGSTTAVAVGLKSATFVLDGTPSMRFYLADGVDASKYEFFIGSKRVNAEVSKDGKYVDIDVYAYALCESVTYTIDGEVAGSFHINAYYTYVSGSSYTGADKAELVKLTEAFWRYLQSARDFRNSVVNN